MSDFLKLVFMATFIIAPVLSNKITTILGFTVPVGLIFAVIIMYGIIDVLNFKLGAKEVRKFMLQALFVKLIIYLVFIPIAVHLPPAEFWKGQQVYAEWLGHSIRLMIASELVVLLGQYVIDIKVFQRLSNWNWFFRVWGSDTISQLIQSVGFILIGFIGQEFPLVPMILSAYVIRMALSVVKSILFYPIVKRGD